MTKPDLMAELAEVVKLDGLATPGKVELHTSCSWRRIMADQWRPFLVPGIDPDRHPNMDSIENAQFVVALVNWYRTHHAELEAAVRDAARYAPCLWVPDDDTDSWDTACGNKHQFIAGDAADNLYQHCPYCGGKLIEPNYDAAMHNSAREG
jgi:hypothetical protein